RFEHVGGHARTVAYVITDVIGNNRRITRVVFGDTGFDFTDEVSSDVGGFGVDSTTHAHKESGQRPAKSEPNQEFGCIRWERQKDQSRAKQSHTDGDQAGNRSTAEGNFQG